MDSARALQLLDSERARIEGAIADLEREGPLEAGGRIEPGERGSEDLYEDELAQGRRDVLREQLAAVERAAGAYAGAQERAAVHASRVPGLISARRIGGGFAHQPRLRRGCVARRKG